MNRGGERGGGGVSLQCWINKLSKKQKKEKEREKQKKEGKSKCVAKGQSIVFKSKCKLVIQQTATTVTKRQRRSKRSKKN